MAKVLIVEDDVTISSIVKDWLENQRHVVDTANTGREAKSLLLVCKYDLIVLDWQLPEMTGIEILKEFREKGGQTPVLMLTARGEMPDKETGFGAGADDYLTKPFQIKELGLRITALLRRPSTYVGKVLSVKDIVVDTSTHKVTRAGKDLHLHPKEYALLEFFLLHPNQLFSAEALLERVWPSESESTVNALVVSIRRLRQKLDDPASEASIISNIRGSGYMLEIK